nr:hypothetical protein TetV2_00424 [Oceanusvirus sp.]
MPDVGRLTCLDPATEPPNGLGELRALRKLWLDNEPMSRVCNARRFQSLPECKLFLKKNSSV